MSEGAFGSNWELLKFKAAQYLRDCGSSVVKKQRLEEERVTSKIIILSQKNPADLSEQERLEFISEQNKLNETDLCKAKGAFIRSRKKGLKKENRTQLISLTWKDVKEG